MDVTMMPFVAEAALPAPTQKASGKADSGPGEDGGFAAVFADLVDKAPPSSEGEKKVAADDPSGDAPGTAPGLVPGMVPGMWSFVPLMPPAMNAGQAQTAAEGAGAIAPLTAAGLQVATRPDAARGQSLPGAPAAPPLTADADLVSQLTQSNQQPQQNTQHQLPAAAAPALTAAMPATAPAVQAKDAPAVPAVPVTVAVTAAAPSEAPPAAVPDTTATAAPPPQAAAPQVAAVQAAVAPAPVPATVKPPNAGAAPQTESVPDAGVPVEAAAPAPPVPAVTAKPAATGDDDAALTADNPTPDAPQQPAASATATPTAFAALVDQKLAPATATAAEATPAAQQPSGPDPNNVAGQIVDNARLITRAANSEMVIKLKPEHLGELTLKIAVDNGSVSATFHTASAEVRSAIEASLPQLRQDMASQGLKVDYVGVYASLDHFFANDQRHAPQQQQVPTARRQGGDESYTDAVAAAAGLADSQTAGGIDYRV